MAGKVFRVVSDKTSQPQNDTKPKEFLLAWTEMCRFPAAGKNQGSAFPLPCPGLDLGCVGDVLLLPDILLLLVVVELLDALVAAGLEQGGVGLQDQREITFQRVSGDTALSPSLRADQIWLSSGAGITWDHHSPAAALLGDSKPGKARNSLAMFRSKRNPSLPMLP